MPAARQYTLPLLAILCFAQSARSQQLPNLPGDTPAAAVAANAQPNVTWCMVDLIETLELPATEAGVLTLQSAKEGDNIKAEEVIAKIDSRMQEMEKRIAIYEYNAAVKRANDDIEIKYSRKAAEVAEAEYQELLAVEDRVQDSIPDPELRKAKLDFERSLLAIEKASNDRTLAQLDARAAYGKLEATKLAIDRRTILAPFSGQVVQVYRHQQEWVNPGDPILQLVRLDTLKVNGPINMAELARDEVAGCEVTVAVKGDKGRVYKANGRIVSISHQVQRDGSVNVTAEITNRSSNGQWIILPRMKGTMTIHLGTGGAGRVGMKPAARQ